MTPEATYDWAELLGRLHPVLVHVPIGLVFGAGLVELFGFGELPRRFVLLRRALLVACALAAGVTATSGWFLGDSGGYDADILGWHRWLSVAFAVLVGLAALADLLGSSGFARRAALLLALTLVVVSGHQGGSLTHGSSYLTRGAPPWMRAAVEAISPLSYLDEGEGEVAQAEDAAEGGEEGGEGEPAAPGVGATEAGASDGRVVLEFLERSCFRCHGPEKSKAGLRLDQRDGLLSVIDPGAAPDSEIFRRVTLPEGHGDEMPSDGPPLSDAEIASLRRWINAGASPLERPAPTVPADADPAPGEGTDQGR